MSSIVESLYDLNYNPFRYGEYIASFYSSLNGVEDDLLLARLVIPLCSHPEYGSKLKRAMFGEKLKSTLWSIFKEREKLYDLQERLDEFRYLTEKSIQYCIANDKLRIEEGQLSLQYIGSWDKNFKECKKAVKLGKLMSGYTVIEIYTFLGVKL